MRRCVKCSKRRGTYPLGVHPVHAVSNHLDSTKRGRRRESAEGETSRVGRRRAALSSQPTRTTQTMVPVERRLQPQRRRSQPTGRRHKSKHAPLRCKRAHTAGTEGEKTKRGRSDAKNVHVWPRMFSFFLRWRYRVDAPVGYAEKPYTTRRTLTLAGPAFVGYYNGFRIPALVAGTNRSRRHKKISRELQTMHIDCFDGEWRCCFSRTT